MVCLERGILIEFRRFFDLSIFSDIQGGIILYTGLAVFSIIFRIIGKNSQRQVLPAQDAAYIAFLYFETIVVRRYPWLSKQFGHSVCVSICLLYLST